MRRYYISQRFCITSCVGITFRNVYYIMRFNTRAWNHIVYAPIYAPIPAFLPNRVGRTHTIHKSLWDANLKIKERNWNNCFVLIQFLLRPKGLRLCIFSRFGMSLTHTKHLGVWSFCIAINKIKACIAWKSFQANWSGRYPTVRRCEGLSVASVQMRDPSELFMKRSKYLHDFGFISCRDMY